MSMRGLIFALQLLGLLQLGKSQTSCTSDVAIPIDDIAASGSSSGSGSGSGSGSDAGAAAAIASYQVAGASAIVDLTGSNLDGGSGGPADLIDIGVRRLLRKRAVLECTSSETCYSLQGDPLCVDDQTNDFHLDDGTTGNLVTGDYTLPDGQEGNFNTGPYPTLSAAGASTTFDSATASATGTGDASTITPAAGSTDPGTTASASDTPTQSAGSTLAAETGASASSSPSSSTGPSRTISSNTSTGSTAAAETEEPSSSSSSSTRTTRTTSAAASASRSAQAFTGAAAPPSQVSNLHFMLLAAMGLRAVL